MMERTPNSISSNNELDVRNTFRMISYLLQYPEKRWLKWKELVDGIKQFEDSPLTEYLLSFLNEIGEISLDDLSEQYVQLFDFNPKCSLNLTYLKAGEQRKRGQILVELKELYKENGFLMTDEELPDYLPLVLEFVSVAPLDISVNLLGSLRESIEKLKAELAHLNSPYRHLAEACLAGAVILEKITLSREGD
ncbi:nitrate reductase molybdenum cofactor assembly chaperone [Bacillota bacterium Lsc_1132]